MDNSEIFFPKDIYEKHLTTINGARFTEREIDVVACLLNGRRTSAIASLLAIAPRTVTTHFRNIMLKLDCNSQDGIISFVEKSPNRPILRQYYSSLILARAFEKCLRDILKLRRDESKSGLVVYWKHEALKETLLCHLENHLRMIGLHVEIREQEIYSTIKSMDPKTPCLLFLIEKKEHENSEKFSNSSIDSIDLSDQKNYYFAVFDVLKKLSPHTNLEIILASFKEKYTAVNSVISVIPSSVLTELPKDPCSVLTVESKEDSSRPMVDIENYEAVKSHWIRSDLVIPIESSLLQRPEIIFEIEEKFKEQKGIQIVALIGIGGAGKTTLARQYASRQESNVIWEINAETSENLKKSFEKLAQAFSKTEEDRKALSEIQGIKNANDREEKIIFFVKQHLRLHPNWLLIFDNVEKFTDIQKYFPQDCATWGQGKVIITTKNSNIKNNTYIHCVISIGELSFEQKFTLFTKIMSNDSSHLSLHSKTEETNTFLEEIPSFPLDVTVAAYYLKATNISYEKYLENLSKHREDFERVQENLIKEAGSYIKTRYGIIILSVQQLIRAHEDFSDLLLAISLLNSQNIPRKLLEKYKGNISVDNFIYNLKKYSLVLDEMSSISTFSIHRSTQEICLDFFMRELDLEGKNKIIIEIFDNLQQYLNNLLENENIQELKVLVCHYESFLSHNNLLTDTIKNSIKVELGVTYFYLGDYEKAKRTLEEAFEIMHDNDYKKTLQFARACSFIAIVHRELGDYEKAKYFLEQSLIVYKKTPKNYSDLARVQAYLGNIYRELGDYKKARCLLEYSLDLYKKDPSQNSSGAIWASVRLGTVYKNMGDYKKAISILEDSLAAYKKYFSESHIQVSWTLVHLANVYIEIGYYEKAKYLCEKSLETHKNELGDDNLITVWVLALLGRIYVKVGAYAEAEIIFERVLEVYKKQLNTAHLKIAWVLFQLGNLYNALGKYKKAKELITNSLITYREHYGEVHVDSARVLISLGQTYLKEDHLKIAESHFMKALEVFQNNNHPNEYIIFEHLTTLNIKKSVFEQKNGNQQRSQAFSKKAISCLKKALKIANKHFPENSPHLIRLQDKLKKLEQDRLESFIDIPSQMI
jgi:tetratricopeptide (TPR) repeat protein/DNA-binding CsgD family transcriptional regulator